MLNVFILFLRYSGAIILAFVASALLFIASSLTFVSEPMLGVLRSHDFFMKVLSALESILCGVVGVYVGSIIAPKASRNIASWLFTLLGMLFYLWFWLTMVYSTAIHRGEDIPWPWMLPWLGLGGSIVSISFSLKKRKKS